MCGHNAAWLLRGVLGLAPQFAAIFGHDAVGLRRGGRGLVRSWCAAQIFRALFSPQGALMRPLSETDDTRQSCLIRKVVTNLGCVVLWMGCMWDD